MFVIKPNVTSIMWNYFRLEANEGGMPKDTFMLNFY